MTQPRMTRLEFHNRLRLYLAGTMAKMPLPIVLITDGQVSGRATSIASLRS
jgi:hypothetical protein